MTGIDDPGDLSRLGDLRGKRVLVRSDLNVPLEGSTITDDGRIRASVPTIKQLSEAGAREGGLEFAASFEELMKPTHGECSADCWCHNSPDEADACQRDRAMKEQLHEHDH